MLWPTYICFATSIRKKKQKEEVIMKIKTFFSDKTAEQRGKVSVK